MRLFASSLQKQVLRRKKTGSTSPMSTSSSSHFVTLHGTWDLAAHQWRHVGYSRWKAIIQDRTMGAVSLLWGPIASPISTRWLGLNILQTPKAIYPPGYEHAVAAVAWSCTPLPSIRNHHVLTFLTCYFQNPRNYFCIWVRILPQPSPDSTHPTNRYVGIRAPGDEPVVSRIPGVQ
jgi:hypothetical protein